MARHRRRKSSVRLLSRPPERWANPTPMEDALAEVVSDYPGEWALIRTYKRRKSANQIAYELRRGTIPAPAGRWEFTSGAVEDDPGMYGVWARYLGETAERNPQ